MSDPAELVAGLAALFGFRPRESLLFLAVDGSRGRLGFRARVDVPGVADVEQAVGQLVHAGEVNRVSSVIVMAHSDERSLRIRSVRALADAFEQRQVEIVDAIHLDDQRFWSLQCGVASCCPPRGTAYDASTSLLVAEAVVSGQRIVGERSELAAEFGEPDDDTARRMSRHCDRVRARLVQEHGVDPAASGALPDLAVLRAGGVRVKTLIGRAITTGPDDISDADAAELAIWCRCVTVRDIAWSLVDIGDAREHLRLWSAVAGRTIAPFEPAVLSLAAFCAWMSGDGARAACALDRALRADPGYSMAHLLEAVLTNALAPSIWEPVAEHAVWEAARLAQ